MLTSQKVIDAINEQIGYEFSAELQYYAIAAHFAAEALPQLSQHFFQQAEEEKGHALRFIKYVVDAGGRVVIPGIDAPNLHACPNRALRPPGHLDAPFRAHRCRRRVRWLVGGRLALTGARDRTGQVG